MPSRVLLRRSGFAVLAVASLVASFTLGVVAGAGSTPEAQPSGVLDDAAAQISGSSLNAVDREALDAAAIKAMLSVAGDRWGSWAESTNGSYAGVGLSLRAEAQRLVISQVVPQGPAAQAGLLVGDRLDAVDDQLTRGRTPAEVSLSLRGAAGSTVSLLVTRAEATRLIRLTRATVPVASVTSTLLDRHVGRITVPAFGHGTGKQVRDAFADLRRRGATSIVLDLRGNPGGLLAEAVDTASAFLRGGLVVSYTRRDADARQLDAAAHGDVTTPLVVLVDGGTASAAEIVAGALQDRGRAVLVGARTFGKGSVQEPHPLSDGSALALTVATYQLPSGRSVEGVGLEPDIEVAPEAAEARALEVLSGLLADSGGRG
jgi:carboxyl-terminal processing protease